MRILAVAGLLVTAFLAVVRAFGNGTISGITVGTHADHIYCDSIICPPLPATAKCRVIRKRDPDDESRIILIRKCLNSDGRILMQTEGSYGYRYLKYNYPVTVTLIPGKLGSETIASDPSDDD